MTQSLRRNQKQKVAPVDALKLAASRARANASEKSYDYPIQQPKIMPGVVPAGVAVAMDSASVYDYARQMYQGNGGGFPGFQYLAQLATRAEYRAFAATLSTEITREWIRFTSKQDDDTDTAEKIKAIEAEFIRLNVRNVVGLAVANDCFFGRGQLFIGFKGDYDQRKLPLILDPATVPLGSLERISSVEAVWTSPSEYDALDPASPNFYKPVRWFMLGQEVHSSRLLTVITRPLPDILKPAFNFAGMSLSQLAEPYVDNWLRTRQAVADLIDNFSTTALKTSMDQVLQGDDDGSSVNDRADLFTLTRSNRGLMLLDKENEDLVQLNVPLGGLHELQAQSQEHMCSVSRMPAIVLTGISPSGLNASSDGEIRVFYDWIAAQQEAFWRSPIDVILKCVQLSLFGEIDDDIGFEFVPLYQMTPKELSEIREADARTATAYVGMGAVDPSEVRDNLAKDPNSGYQGLDTSIVPQVPTDPTDETDPLEADDASVSEKQHRAMEAAAHGKSTLGIPKSVGKEFVAKDAEFKESDHPRAANGQFGSGGGSSKPTMPDTLKIGGRTVSTKDSQGNSLGDDEESIKKFYEWFGDSDVVDSKGRPKVVYHGTNAKFDKFDSSKADGFWFTDNLSALTDDDGQIGAQGVNYIKKAYLKSDSLLTNGPNSDVDSIKDDGYDGIKNNYDYGTDYCVLDDSQIRVIDEIDNRS